MIAKRFVLGSVFITASVALHTAAGSPQDKMQARQITVIAKRFAFVPSELSLKKGQPVVLILQSDDVLHGIRFKELNLETEIRKNQASELAFTPQRTGTFIGRCSRFCGSGHGEMTLTLHVTD